jgi:hypothetical protein
MTFDDVSGHSYTLPAMPMARMNVPVLQIIQEIKVKRGRREKERRKVGEDYPMSSPSYIQGQFLTKPGIQLRYSGIRDSSNEYQTSKKYEIVAKINF